jgi:SAM-dependent methyltransferase
MDAPAIKRVLHVGCGPKSVTGLHEIFRTGEWQEVRLDIDPGVQPDIVSSITSMPEVLSDSFDAVWSSHNLEHLFAHEVPLALREFHRVLKGNGLALLTMPDLQRAAEFLAQGKFEETLYESPAGPIAAIDICFGLRTAIARGNHFMAHKTGFSAPSLGQKLVACGFHNVQVQRRNLELWAIAYKPQ